jgi:hypothetical protein
LQCVVGRVMRAEFGVEIAENPDANGGRHAIILIEGSREKEAQAGEEGDNRANWLLGKRADRGLSALFIA